MPPATPSSQADRIAPADKSPSDLVAFWSVLELNPNGRFARRRESGRRSRVLSRNPAHIPVRRTDLDRRKHVWRTRTAGLLLVSTPETNRAGRPRTISPGQTG